MKVKLNAQREVRLLENGIGLIEHLNCNYVAYNTKFLGYNYRGYYVINGESTRDSKSLDEFCYGYDGENHELHLLNIYQTKKGKKYAATEVSMCVYGFWDIIE